MTLFEHDYKKYPELTNKEIEEFQFSSPHKQITEDFLATVVKVHDGDTITLMADFRNFKFPLRLLGIDAPEMNAGGEIARDWLKDKILGNVVYIEMDQEQRVGKWGRLLGKVIHRGMDIGDEEVYLGLAKPFEERGEEIPDINEIFSIKKWL